MSATAETTMAGLDAIKHSAERAGQKVADYLVSQFPVPLPETILSDATDVLLHDLAECFLVHNRPDVFSEQFIELMQSAAFNSFAARLQSITEAAASRGGAA